MKSKSAVLTVGVAFLLFSAYGFFYAREVKVESPERNVSSDNEGGGPDPAELDKSTGAATEDSATEAEKASAKPNRTYFGVQHLFSAFSFRAREARVESSERNVTSNKVGSTPAHSELDKAAAAANQDSAAEAHEAGDNPECTYFGAQHEKYALAGLREHLRARFKNRTLSGRSGSRRSLTEQVAAKLPSQPTTEEIKFPFEPPYGNDPVNYTNFIDRHIFSALQTAGVPPAKPASDYEFIRRVTLDLTGRIPNKDRLLSFMADGSPDKREKLVDELLNAPEWLDKWTMFFGDLYQNTQQNTQINMYQPGALAFHNWIRDSLANNKPYDQMARELITAQGTNSYDTGTINWLVGGSMGGGPYQDHVDARTARVAQHLLGLAHMNCVGCHDGAGHLDSLSLWGKDAKRIQFWQMASFLSHTEVYSTRVDPAVANPVYWGIREDANATYQQDYRLNTTTGNRPPRQPINGMQRVSPWYPFGGGGGPMNENYRVALARLVTSDFQFARAAVNYIWREFFGIGIVDPPDFFDLARLDENNPPPAPWTLQPSHPALLRELAQEFISGNYDLKTLMRKIVNSKAYQLSSRYNGSWNPTWERLFARKLVRRLWGEEIHDAVVQSSGIVSNYNLGAVYGTKSWAMQFPDTRPVFLQFVDDFMNGNRDEEDRLHEVSIQQALNLMNNNVVMSRVVASNPNGLMARSLSLPNDQLVDHLFLTVLSRYPTEAEKTLAVSSLQTGTRSQKAENLLWALYNKVDFIFNY
jgi:hypothetical protein